ncbi:22855_t:CDS:1, partial [Gigaspora margarita]
VTGHVYEPNWKYDANNCYESLSYVVLEVLFTKNITYQTDIYSFDNLLYKIMPDLSPIKSYSKNIPELVEHLITQC